MKQSKSLAAVALVAVLSALPLSNEAHARGGVYFSGGVVGAPAYPPYYSAYPYYAYPPPAYAYAPPPPPPGYVPAPAYGYAPPVAYSAPVVGGVGVRF